MPKVKTLELLDLLFNLSLTVEGFPESCNRCGNSECMKYTFDAPKELERHSVWLECEIRELENIENEAL